MTFLCPKVDQAQNNRYAFESNEAAALEADALRKKDKSGPFAVHHSALWGGFLKLPGLEGLPEYKALDKGMCAQRVVMVMRC